MYILYTLAFFDNGCMLTEELNSFVSLLSLQVYSEKKLTIKQVSMQAQNW